MCCQSQIVVSVATEVEASCEAVWNVIADIDSMPSVLTPTLSVERLSTDTDDFCVGTRWKETRLYQGNEIVQIKTVTSIRKEGTCMSAPSLCSSRCMTCSAHILLVCPTAGGYSVAINVSYPNELKDFTNTSTLEIRPSGGDKNKSLLIGSFGILPGGIFSRIVVCLCRRNFARSGEKSFLVELEEIGKAAVEKSQKQQG